MKHIKSGLITMLLIVSLNGIAQGVMLDGFAARVNGTAILRSDVRVEEAILRSLAMMTAQSGQMDQSGQLDQTGQESLGITRGDILEELIDRELLLQQAHKFISQTINDEDVDQHVSMFDQQFGGETQRDRFLKENHISQEFWRLRLRNLVLLQRYLEQRVEAFVRVSREEEDQYLMTNRVELGLGQDDVSFQTIPDDHQLRKIVRKLLELKAAEDRKIQLLMNLRDASEIVYCVDPHEPGWETVSESKSPEEN